MRKLIAVGVLVLALSGCDDYAGLVQEASCKPTGCKLTVKTDGGVTQYHSVDAATAKKCSPGKRWPTCKNS